jgi:PIN domain nuclease of toxin-antitoxin system
MSVVLDASAVLAFLHSESGAEEVTPLLDGALLSVVNWSEVAQKSLALGVDVSAIREGLLQLGVAIEPMTIEQAETTAALWVQVKDCGLSLADRACLALAMEGGLSAVTADRAWKTLDLELDIRLIR